MSKTPAVEASIRELGMEFFQDDRVHIWYRSARSWKAATVRAVIFEPPPGSRTHYLVRRAGMAPRPGRSKTEHS